MKILTESILVRDLVPGTLIVTVSGAMFVVTARHVGETTIIRWMKFSSYTRSWSLEPERRYNILYEWIPDPRSHYMIPTSSCGG